MAVSGASENDPISKAMVDLVGYENGTAEADTLTKLEATLLLQFSIYRESYRTNTEFN